MTAFADAVARHHVSGNVRIHLATDLAALLPGWRHDPARSPSRLHGPNRGRLLVEVLTNGRAPHVRIVPKLPDGTPYRLLEDARSRSITVALDRGPAVIAREITRRLLPDLEADLKAAADLHSSLQSDREHQDTRIQAVLALIPGSTERDRHPANTTRSIDLPGPGTAGVGIALDGTEMLSFSGIPSALMDRLLDTYRQAITVKEN